MTVMNLASISERKAQGSDAASPLQFTAIPSTLA
jgi:hypothetical protein